MAARTNHNDEELIKMWDRFEIDSEPNFREKHQLLTSLTEQYNAFLGLSGQSAFTPKQVRRRRYQINYQPSHNALRREKALEKRKTRVKPTPEESNVETVPQVDSSTPQQYAVQT